ncbi:unnamed protein product [Echinostoma caproni]|uniref:Uncharacterized protein n=1 Tax=Echinostoma caproni TaxID=27848 RepID=A0A3P8HJE3_9TREM|nr:unnamed protein product [Echinostoma caproni]
MSFHRAVRLSPRSKDCLIAPNWDKRTPVSVLYERRASDLLTLGAECMETSNQANDAADPDSAEFGSVPHSYSTVGTRVSTNRCCKSRVNTSRHRFGTRRSTTTNAEAPALIPHEQLMTTTDMSANMWPFAEMFGSGLCDCRDAETEASDFFDQSQNAHLVGQKGLQLIIMEP